MWVRISACATAVAVAATSAWAEAPKKRPAPAPRTAAEAAVPASYRTASLGHGYSARDRHMADCLASYRGYDPATDRITIRPGVTRRCEL